jgi:hypothetical protein
VPPLGPGAVPKRGAIEWEWYSDRKCERLGSRDVTSRVRDRIDRRRGANEWDIAIEERGK